MAPKKERIAFSDLSHIGIVDTDGSNVVWVTSGSGYDSEPTWKPDGTAIAFTRHGEGMPPGGEVWVAFADGRPERRAADGDNGSPKWWPYRSLLWFAGGTKRLYSSLRDGRTHLFVSDSNGRNERMLTDNGVEPTLSPDETWVAFRSLETFAGSIRIINIDGTGETVIKLNADNPSWSPDGTRILYRAIEVLGGIWSMNPDGSNETRILAGQGFYPAWSPSPVAWPAFQ